MIVLYHCYSANHTSVTAANVHLGRLPRDRQATYHEILSQPGFDRTHRRHMGTPLPMGTDPRGHRVYCWGLGAGKERLAEAALQLVREAGGRTDHLLPVSVLNAANWWMRIGGWLSRRADLVAPGRPVVTFGTWLAYRALVRCALSAQDRLP